MSLHDLFYWHHKIAFLSYNFTTYVELIKQIWENDRISALTSEPSHKL